MFDSAAQNARLADVRDRIARAAGRARRDPTSIRLIAVSKTFPADCVRAALDAGQLEFGENKVQDGLSKMDQIADPRITWHLIGHLQSNKAKKAGARFDVIHSADQAALVRAVDQAAGAAGRRIELLIQVDMAGESTKHGARESELPPILEAARSCTAARVVGLMVLPPAADDPEAARPYFRSLKQLRDRLLATGADPSMLSQLSMGMSDDFEVAVEEGATLVRVGTAIFGSRT